MSGDAASASSSSTSRVQDVGRWVLGAALLTAGTSHLTWQRQEFQAQVPSWFPVDKDLVVVASGIVEIALGAALLVATKRRAQVGWTTAAFFVVIFPGNIAQYVEGTDAFGLDSDRARAVRLAFQPALVAAALWSTGAWAAWRSRRRNDHVKDAA
jgi:uncharacterized membrane protein